jgi:hypothetical protein
MTYYTHHSRRAALHYVSASLCSQYSGPWMIYYTLHQYGYTPLCVRWFDFRLDCCLNNLLHTSQQYGCSPLWTRLCLLRLFWWMNDILHTSQKNGRSHYVWTYACSDNLITAHITHITAIWQLATTYVLMSLQIRLQTEWFITHITTEWPLPTM